MAAGTQSPQESELDAESRETPDISVCETRPGRSVFLESGNTDGWIASDTTTDVTR